MLQQVRGLPFGSRVRRVALRGRGPGSEPQRPVPALAPQLRVVKHWHAICKGDPQRCVAQALHAAHWAAFDEVDCGQEVFLCLHKHDSSSFHVLRACSSSVSLPAVCDAALYTLRCLELEILWALFRTMQRRTSGIAFLAIAAVVLCTSSRTFVPSRCPRLTGERGGFAAVGALCFRLASEADYSLHHEPGDAKYINFPLK